MKKTTLLRILRVMARFALVSLGIFMVLLVGAFVLAYFFSGNLVNYYRAQIERTLNVSIAIHKSSLSGRTLTLQGIQIQTRGGAPLARIEELTAPLNPYYGILYGPARWVSDLRVKRPRLQITYGPDGRLNWDSVTFPRRLAEGPLENAYRGQVRLEEGSLSLHDQRRGEYLAQLEDINAELSWQPERSWTAQGQAQQGALKFNLVGHQAEPIIADLDLKNLALDDYLIHPVLFDEVRVQGSVANGRLQLRLNPQELPSSLVLGDLHLEARNLALPRQRQRFDKLSARFEMLGSTLEVKQANLSWNQLPLSLTGQVRPGTGDLPWIKVRLLAGPAALEKLARVFPQLPKARGRAKLDVLAEGPLNDPSLQGQLTGSQLRLAGQELRDLVADFELDSHSLYLKRVLAHGPQGEPWQASGWIFRDSARQQKLFLRLRGDASQLGALSPWLAGTDQVRVTALGSLLEPVLAGQAQLNRLPANPLGLTSGRTNFWLDQQSALLWGAQLNGAGGQIQVPWAVADYHTGQLDADAYLRDYRYNQAQLNAVAQISGNYLTNQFEGLAYLDDSRIQAPGLPVVDSVSGLVGFQDGRLLIPQLDLQSGGDRLALTGELTLDQKGTVFLHSPQLDAQRWLASVPGGPRNLTAVAELDGTDLKGFRLASLGPSGDAYAVGRWTAGRPPEFFTQFAHLQASGARLDGQLATAWQDGRLNYFYGLRPSGAPLQNWVAGSGYLRNQRLQMVNNFLNLPSTLETASLQGEGRAYSYFGPTEGPPLQIRRAPAHGQGLLTFSGGLDLKSRRLDQVKLKGRNLNLRQLESWFGPLPLPVWWQQFDTRLEDALVDVDGQLAGTLGAPQLKASLRSPWTRLSRLRDGQLESSAFSWRADAQYQKGRLQLLSLLSPHPQDSQLLSWKGPRQSPAEPDWLRSRLEIDPKLAWKGWIRAQAFPMATAGWLTPPWLADKLPSGVLSTSREGLQISGTLHDPQLAGRVDLRQGRFWTGYAYVPIDEAFVDFESGKRSVNLSRFHLRSAGLTLEGRGQRSPDGSLSAQLWADDLTLDTLNQFGWNTQGWKGSVDLAFAFKDGRGGVSPQGWLALYGNHLHSNREGVFGINRLVLGQIRQGDDGIPYTGPGLGIAFRLNRGEVTVDLPPQGAEVVWDTPTPSRALLEGQFSFRSAMASGQTLWQWVTSADGPRFGHGNQPLRLAVQQMSWALARQLFGLEPDQREGILSASLELLGQYHEQHRTKAPKISGKPLLTAQLTELLLEGPGAVWSGVKLRQPMRLAYVVVPGAGWLRLEPATFDLFAQKAREMAGTLNLEAHFVAMENPGLKKAASQNPDQVVRASLQDVPVQNLSFLFPRLTRLGGQLKSLELSHKGPFSQPDAHLSLSAQNVQIQGLNITAAQGSANLTGQSPGRMKLDFGEGADELRVLLGAENDLTQALRFQGQATLDFDRMLLPKNPTMVSSWSGWSLTERSEFDLSAQLNDPQMRLLGGFAPVGSVLGGSLKAGLQLQGTSAKPELTGTLALENGSLTHPRLTSPLSGLNLLSRFERIPISQADPASILSGVSDETLGRVTLERLDGNLGGQPFQGKGKAELAGRLPTFLDFQFDGDELPVQWDGLLDGKANVHLKLGGEPRPTGGLKPLLTGRIELPQANLALPDQETLNRLLALSSGRKRLMDYSIDLSLGNDVWAGFLGSTIRASGDLHVSPSPTRGRPLVNGELFLSRGVIRIPVYEVNFRVRQGYAYFEDDIIPRIDNLEADSTLGTYQITARFDGKYPNIQADLFSNPPLPESDLRRLVGLGALPSTAASTTLTSSAVNPNANNFLVNQSISILSNMLTGALSQGLGRLLFASEVAFDVLPTSEYVIRLAKSLNDRDTFLLTFAQVIGTTRFNQTLTQYGVEWRFQPNLLTRVTLDNYGQAKIWFQGVLRF